VVHVCLGNCKRPRLFLMASVWSVSCAFFQTDQSSFTFSEASLAPWLNCPAKFDGGVGAARVGHFLWIWHPIWRPSKFNEQIAHYHSWFQSNYLESKLICWKLNQVLHCGNEWQFLLLYYRVKRNIDFVLKKLNLSPFFCCRCGSWSGHWKIHRIIDF